MIIKVPARLYKQYDADYALEIPAEGYGGWAPLEIDLDLSHTVILVMHAWDCGTKEQYPGWFRHVEYLQRAILIAKNIFPGLLQAARETGMKIFHVVGGGSYYKSLAGFQKAKKLEEHLGSRLARNQDPFKSPWHVERSESRKKLDTLRASFAGGGDHNQEDIRRGFQNIDFLPEARPVGDEGIAENARQLFALCKDAEIDHLIYIGFAINWCLLLSPGGMAEMSKMGLMCSTIEQGVTAVENKDSARHEWAKKLSLWRVAFIFGFVFDLDPLVQALQKVKKYAINK